MILYNIYNISINNLDIKVIIQENLLSIFNTII